MTTNADTWGKLGPAELREEMRALAVDARTTFGGLTPQQLNWKPSAGQWSVGQCFEHLLKTNEPYAPVIEGVARGERRPTAWERLSPLSGFWGSFVLRSVVPESARKIKARPNFQPSSSSVDAGIVGRFADLQERLAELMGRTRDMGPEKVVITSPVAGFVTYSLLDGYRIILAHGRRHFEQARRVTRAEGFPKS
jgi:hypothetical protein